jgi:hypothetical protein
LAANNGKALEAKTTKVLKELVTKQKGYSHRFVDKTQAMSGHIPKAPGDYLLLIPGKAILVECKSSITGRGLLSLAHKNPVQVAEHKKFLRAGHASLYVYLCLKSDIIELHSGANVVLKVDKPLFVGKSKDFLTGLKSVVEEL